MKLFVLSEMSPAADQSQRLVGRAHPFRLNSYRGQINFNWPLHYGLALGLFHDLSQGFLKKEPLPSFFNSYRTKNRSGEMLAVQLKEFDIYERQQNKRHQYACKQCG